jgi:erythromycin esterase-like protein
MTLRTLTTTVLAASAIASALLAPAAHAAPAPGGASATAQSALLDAFADHRIVALGQAHGLRQQDDFILALLRHPRFAATVDSIVVEFGNARFQGLADRYVAGGDVTLRALRPVWRDQVGAAPDGVADEGPARLGSMESSFGKPG